MTAPSNNTGLAQPRTTCPFSGTPLSFAETSGGWQVRGKGWVSTRMYASRELAEWAFSHSEGVPPTYPDPLKPASTVKEELPPVETAGDDLRRAEKQGNELASLT